MRSSQDRPADLRSAAHKRYSEFFHGTSSIGRHHSKARGSHNRKTLRSGLRCHPPDGGIDVRQLHTNISAPRSPTSIRSLIDPSSLTPSVGTPLSAVALSQPQGTSRVHGLAIDRPATTQIVKVAKPRKVVSYLRTRWDRQSKMSRGLLPTFKNKAAQKKFIKCTIFGALLVLILVICISSFSLVVGSMLC